MRKFKIASLNNLGQAFSFLEKNQGKATIISGGCDLLNLLKGKVEQPEFLVNLKTFDGQLHYIEQSPTELKIGALATMSEIESHPMIRERFAALAEASSVVASPQIRNVGTLGGNLCQRPWCWYFRRGFPCYKNGGNVCFSVTGDNRYHAIFGGGPSFIVHPSDTAPALIALGAEVKILGPTGGKRVDLEKFFVGPDQELLKENILQPGEIVAEICLPDRVPRTRSTYIKFSERQSWDHAIVSVAAALTKKGEICDAVRIVLGGVAPIPWRVPEAERLVVGKKIDEGLAAQAGDVALEGASPLSRNEYKIDLARNLVKRALLSLWHQP